MDVDGINDSIDTPILHPTHFLLVHLAALENGRNTYIGTHKKDKGDIFSEWCAKSVKEVFLRYVNEVQFEMDKTYLKETFLEEITPIEMQNEVSTCRQMCYDRDTHVIVNQSINEFYTRFLFKIGGLPQDAVFPLDIAANFFNNLSPNIREIFISEGVQVPQGYQLKKSPGKPEAHFSQKCGSRSKKQVRTKKSVVQPESGSRHPSTFVGVLGENPSTQMAGLGSSFQSE